MKWPQIDIHTAHGIKTGIAPMVISASRTTDIPAFHAEWFMNRVRAGYCLWANPFNSKQQQYVSFEKCKAFVFWTKNPQKLMPSLAELDSRGYQYYFQYTLNDYDAEKLEPNLSCVQKRVEIFQELSETIGKHRVIWRFDPIILGNALRVGDILAKYENIMQSIAPYTEKCVFSFVDWYKKTENNLKKLDPLYRPPTDGEMREIAQGIAQRVAQVNQSLGEPLQVATCAEALTFEHLGIAHNKCIDPDLLARLCPRDRDMYIFCGKPTTPVQASLFSAQQTPVKQVCIKDKGQRTSCGCAPSKDIGSYNSCLHFCAYCYANQSVKSVESKMQHIQIQGEKL